MFDDTQLYPPPRVLYPAMYVRSVHNSFVIEIKPVYPLKL